MAKLTSLLKFNGSLDGLSAYKMEGMEEEILRQKGGPTKEQIQTDPRFALTRANNKETAGRSRASGLILDTLGGLRPVVDQSCAGRLNALLKAVQEGDTLSPLGERHVQLTGNPRLLEGVNLRKVYPLEEVLLNPLTCRVDKASLSAQVQVPALLPGLNFTSPAAQPLFRVVAALGVVPDLYYERVGDHYFPAPGYRRVSAQTAWTEWFPVRGGSPATALEVHLPEGPEVELFSLVLTVGVQWGTVGAGGSVDIVKKVKSARIERVE